MSALAQHNEVEIDAGDVCCPAGFTAGGIACGIKASGAPDLALIIAQRPASAAGMFTRNLVCAAPLQISAGNLRSSAGRVKAILISSGCANAATGADGLRRAQHTVRDLAALLQCNECEILVNSTGVIGEPLPDNRITAALPALIKQTSQDGLPRAMSAIMTTDTRPKMAQVRVDHNGRTLHVAGIAKGSGMIHPNMATMIGVLLTNAEVAPPKLDSMLRRAVEKSFHRISVDGDTSTNDSVFALASGGGGGGGDGASGSRAEAGENFPDQMIENALTAIARELAIMIVRDGEGARKLIHVRVFGGRNREDALRVAQTVACSMLVRTAVAGGDPNWGRILAAAGRSGAMIDPDQLTVSVNGVPLFAAGAPVDTPLPRQQQAFQAETVILEIGLGQGSASDEFFTCDLTEGYVRINSHYRT